MADQTIIERVQDRSPETEVDLREAFHGLCSAMTILWNQRRLMARIMTAAIGAAVSLAFAIPNQYESTVRIMPPDPEAFSTSSPTLATLIGAGALGGGGGLATSLLGSKTPGALPVAILKSRTVQDSLINRFDLRRVYYKKRYDDTRKKLMNRTDIEDDRESGIISITVRDRDPQRAQQMAQAYVEELDKLVVQLNTSSARRERIFLEDRLKAVEQELEADSRQLSEFSSHNSTLDLAVQGKSMLDAAAKIQADLFAAQAELRSVEATYAWDNVRVRSIKARIAALNSQLHKISGTSNENGADLTPDELYPDLRKLPLLGVTFDDLYRRVKIQATVYEILTKQYELAKVQEAKEIPSLKILDAPSRPEGKGFPPRILIIISATLLMFVVSSGWILALHAGEINNNGNIFGVVVGKVRSGFSDGVKHPAPPGEAT